MNLSCAWTEKSTREVEADDKLDCCSKYKPSNIWPTPIVLQLVRSCIKQQVERKTRQRGCVLVMELTAKRLKEKRVHKEHWLGLCMKKVELILHV